MIYLEKQGWGLISPNQIRFNALRVGLGKKACVSEWYFVFKFYCML